MIWPDYFFRTIDLLLLNKLKSHMFQQEQFFVVMN